MGYSKKIIYLSQTQYDTLIVNGTVTSGNTTITYNADDIYVTPQINPVIQVVTVSGTTPTITGVANTRYNCGEVATISITPPISGIIDVIFTSGTTPTVLTLPNTVKMPEWFDGTALEANRIYEINIVDGIYGAVMSWAV